MEIPVRYLVFVLCLPSFAFSGISPARLEINLGPFPVDRYLSPNSDGALPSCPTTYLIRDCVKLFFNNNVADSPYTPNNYTAQSVTGVRFFYALGDGFFSTPFHSSGTLQSAWLNNLALFFGDLKKYGIQRVTPTSVMIGNWSGTTKVCDGCFGFTHLSLTSCGQFKNLQFYPWLPFGLLDNPGAPDDFFPDGQDFNNAYNCAAANPGFWGWQPWLNLQNGVFQQAHSAGLTIAAFDMENELNVVDFTVEARLIYDNVNRVDVLRQIRQGLAANGFSSTAASFSASSQRPSVAAYSCTSYFGDSALLGNTSALNASMSGQVFGMPSGASWVNGLLCGGTRGNMVRLPVSYRQQPTVTDIHTQPCVLDSTTWSCNTSLDATSTAQTLYSSVWQFLQRNGLQNNSPVFGETVSNQPCDGYTQALASQNVTGFRGSTLYTNAAKRTVMRPWNNDADASRCYVTPSIINPPYDPNNP